MYILIALCVICAFYAISIYNGIIKTKNTALESLSSIDVVLKNRYDLIPNLVATVEKYSDFEKNILTQITALRSQLTDHTKGGRLTKAQVALEEEMSQALRQLTIAVENYPDLKANQSFLHLQQQLTEMEQRLQAARRAYNAAVRSLEDKKEMFPSNLFAKTMNLPQLVYFEAGEQEKENIDVRALFEGAESATKNKGGES